MPKRQDVKQKHAKHFLTILEQIHQLDQSDDAEWGRQLNNLETLWFQIDNARTWASTHSSSNEAARALADAFDNAGVEIAQIRAETRMALRRLKNSFLDPR